MNASMTIDGSEPFEHRAHCEHFEMCLRSFRNTVHVALVLDDQVRGFESFGELVLNSFLASHRASLPRSPLMRERQRNVHTRTAVSFAPCAIQRRP